MNNKPGYQIRNDGIYFLTLTIHNWIDLFTRQIYRDILLDSIRFCQKQKNLEVYAWVIMSNHVHLIASVPGGSLSDVLRDMKQFTAKSFLKAIETEPESRRDWLLREFGFAGRMNSRNKHFQIWTHDNHPVELSSNAMMEQRLEYLHQNPVRAGWVSKPEDWLYSSAGTYAGFDGLLEVVLVE